MNIALSNGENIIRSWDYGKLKGLFLTKGSYTLAITNKKIVSIYYSKNEIIREDYDIKKIQGVYASYQMKKRFFIFKRGSLSISFTTPKYEEVPLVGLSSIKSKNNFLANIPILGWFFGGKRRNVKVNVNAAKEIVEKLSSYIFNTTNTGV